jgi:hypothetical protein
VLNFVFDRRDEQAFDLVAAALHSGEESLASEAAGITAALAHEGRALPSTIRDDLDECARRFPASEVFRRAALQALDRRTQRED